LANLEKEISSDDKEQEVEKVAEKVKLSERSVETPKKKESKPAPASKPKKESPAAQNA